MLRASIPSRSTIVCAAARIRSCESPDGCCCWRRGICTLYCTLYTHGKGGCVVAGRSTARKLVWAAFAGQAAFVASWIVAGALEPRYTHVLQGVSELAARNATHPWIVAVGTAALGLSLVALAFALAL